MLGASALAVSPMARSARAAAPWPTRPITLVVPYPPGGGTDVVARLLAKHLSERLGVGVVVDNRAGAGGRMGTQYVVNASPDGSTLLFGSGAELTMAPATVRNMPYDPLKDLVPIVRIAGGPYVLLGAPAFAPNNVRELVAWAKEHPGQLNFSSGGLYSASHLFELQFNERVGINATHVPYRGSGPSLVALVGNEVQYTVNTPSVTLDLIAAGKVKVLAVCSEKRLDKLPKVPTLIEQGYPGLVGGSWYGLLSPRGTPAAVVERLNQETNRFLEQPSSREMLEKVYIKPIGGSSADFQSFMQAETIRFKDLMARLRLQPE